MPKNTPELPVEAELVDDAWYSTDGIAIARYDKQTHTLAVPGAGVRQVPKRLMRLAAVAAWLAPLDEPKQLGAVVETPSGVRWVRIASMQVGAMDKLWFNILDGFMDWDAIGPGLTLLVGGVLDKAATK